MNEKKELEEGKNIEKKSNEFLDTCSWFLMRKVVRLLTNIMNISFKETGILSTQLGALAILAVRKEMSITEIANELVMDQTTATRNINNLEKMELVKTIEGSDKRLKILTLTTKGKEKLSEVLPIWEEGQNTLNTEIGKEKILLLGEILENILILLQKRLE